MEPTTTAPAVEPAEDFTRPLAEWMRGLFGVKEYAGILMMEVGEEGEYLIAPGHVDPEAFRAAEKAYDLAHNAVSPGYDYSASDAEHVMLAVRPYCPHAEDLANLGPDDPGWTLEGRARHPLGSCNCEGPWFHWGDDGPDRIHPATILDRG